jgi:hypothetical protein
MGNRWVQTEEAVTAFFRGEGWPHAHRTGRGKSGTDVPLDGMPGLAPEIKAQAVLRSAWMKQHQIPGVVPMVIWRPPGFGVATIAQWPVLFSLADATEILRKAGYGSELGS